MAIIRLRISNLTPQLRRRAAGSLSSLIVSRTNCVLVVEFLKRGRCSCVQDEVFLRSRSSVGAVKGKDFTRKGSGPRSLVGLSCFGPVLVEVGIVGFN